MRESITFEKSKQFALRIAKLYKHLVYTKKEYIFSKQLVRCGTSIGANLAEAEYAISEKDFLSKAYISLKECAETKYWLDLLQESEYLSEEEHASISRDCTELLKLLTAITKTMSHKIESKKIKPKN